MLNAIKAISPERSVAFTSLPLRTDIINGEQKLADFNNKLKSFVSVWDKVSFISMEREIKQWREFL